jgi:amino acid adenylation domain-containing protein
VSYQRLDAIQCVQEDREESKNNTDSYPLRLAQERMVLLQALADRQPVYNVPLAITIRGPLDSKALESAIAGVITRHPMLRSRYVQQNGTTRLVIDQWNSFILPITDVGGSPEMLDGLIYSEGRYPFNLSAGPLFRAHLYRLAPLSHILLLSMHHIVVDGRSTNILLQDLATLYLCATTASETTTTDTVEEHAVQPGLSAERRYVDDSHMAYWLKYLAGAPAMLRLPIDRSRPAQRTGVGGTTEFILSLEHVQALKTVSRKAGATLFTLLISAVQVVLHRWTGENDIVVGFQVASRNKETKDVVGYFVNTLLLRSQIDSDLNLGKLVAQVKLALKQAYSHQDVSFEVIVERMGISHRGAYNPVFQVAVNYRSFDTTPFLAANLSVLCECKPTGTAKFDLDWTIEDVPDGLRVRLDYATDLFYPESAQRLLAQMKQLLLQFPMLEQCAIGKIDFLTESDRNWLVDKVGRAETDWPIPALSDMLSGSSGMHLDKTALEMGATTMTYAVFHARTNKLAQWLRINGVGEDVVVGIDVPPSFDMVIAIVAVLKAGGAYLPIPENYPPGRAEFCLAQSSAAFLITSNPLPGRGNGRLMHVVIGDWTTGPVATSNASDPNFTITDEALAYVIYTSGSSGTPKGVQVTRRALANHMNWMITQFGFSDSDTFIQKTSIGFDASVWELLAPVIVGARLVLVTQHEHRHAATLCNIVAEKRVSVLQVVPSVLARLLGEPAFERCSNIRHLFSGGEPLASSLCRQVHAKLPAAIHNLYGPTEACIDATFHTCERTVEVSAAYMPIGRPIANCAAYILDRDMALVPPGTVGELFIGGAGVARGYMCEVPDRASVFLASPFKNGDRLYKSGDLVRWRADGALEFVGRADEQVKIRGVRVELQEIEARLRISEAVRDAVVLLETQANGEQLLTAYLIESGVGQVDLPALRAELARWLPDLMVPVKWGFIDQIPLTPNGKRDRLALASQPLSKEPIINKHRAPQSALEVTIAEVWEGVLDVKGIGLDDNFFQLGGHSFLALKVLSQLRNLIRQPLSLPLLFETKSLGELAGALEASSDFVASDGLSDLLPPPESAEWLPDATRDLWQFSKDSPVANNLLAVYVIRGRLDIARLTHSIHLSVSLHEILQACFPCKEGKPCLLLSEKSSRLNIEQPSLEGKERSIRLRSLTQQLTSRYLTRYELESGPLCSWQLYTFDEDEHYLVFSADHMIADAWSVGILIRQIMASYESHGSSTAPSVASRYIAYASWRSAQVRLLYERNTQFWVSYLSNNPPPIQFQNQSARSEPYVYKANGHARRYDSVTTSAIFAMAKRFGVTSFSVVTAALAQWIHESTKSKEFLLHTEFADREHPAFTETVGFLINHLFLRICVGKEDPLGQTLINVNTELAQCADHRHIPAPFLFSLVRPASDRYGSTLQVAHSFRQGQASKIHTSELQVEEAPVDFTNGIPYLFDVGLSTELFDDEMSLTMYFNIALFSDAAATREFENFQEVLSELLRPQAPAQLTGPAPAGDLDG